MWLFKGSKPGTCRRSFLGEFSQRPGVPPKLLLAEGGLVGPTQACTCFLVQPRAELGLDG